MRGIIVIEEGNKTKVMTSGELELTEVTYFILAIVEAFEIPWAVIAELFSNKSFEEISKEYWSETKGTIQ